MGKYVAFLLIFLFKGQLALANDFSASDTSSCSPLITNFTHTFTNVQRVYWTFGDNSNSSLNAPGKIYIQSGTFTVTLVVYFNDSTNITVTKNSYIHVKATPKVQFSYVINPLGCGNGALVSFTNQTPGVISRVLWDFGDGNSSTSLNPTKIYTASNNYKVIMQVVTPDSCSAVFEDFVNISISKFLVANFNVRDTVFCGNTGSTLLRSTSLFNKPIVSFAFYADGTFIGNLKNTPINITNSGFKSIKLVVVDSVGCIDSIEKNIYFHLFPKLNASSISISSLAVCQNDTVTFASADTTRLYSWEVKTGVQVNGNPAKYAYANAGNYSVTVFSNGMNVCFDTLTLSPPISVIFNPIPQFSVTTNPGCIFPISYSFENLTTGYTSHKYVLKNNTNQTLDSSTTKLATFSISASGNYRINYTGFFGSKCRYDTTISIFIPQKLVKAGFLALPDTGCTPLSVNFQDNSLLRTGDTIINQFWHFGDSISGILNTSAVKNPTHVYNNVGNYTVKYIIETKGGCFDTLTLQKAVKTNLKPNANFTRIDTADCIGLTLDFENKTTDTIAGTTYLWIFGSTSSTAENPKSVMFTKSGLFTVMLIANNLGCTDTMVVPNMIRIYPPLPDFSSLNRISCSQNHTVDFEDKSDSAITWAWDFGDPTSGAANFSNLQNPSHTYTNFGMYDVKLIVSSIYGCVDSITNVNYVILSKPAIDFTVDKNIGCIPFSPQFTYTGSTGSLVWKFGNGLTSTVIKPFSKYSKIGSYDVKIIVRDTLGCVDSLTKNNFISANGISPAFVSTNRTGCAPFSITFFDSTKTKVSSYLWNFGDSTSTQNTSALPNPTHIYKKGGKYAVSLTVSDTAGCTNTLVRTNYVTVNNVTVAINCDSVACKGVSFQITTVDSSASNLTYNWFFSDGTTANGPNPKKTYTTSGFKSLMVVIQNSKGCIDTFYKDNFIRIREVKIKADVTPKIGFCAPFTVSFRDSTDNAVSWSWTFSDNSFSTIQKPSKIFSTNSIFSAKLVVSDIFGCKDSIRMDSVVKIIGPKAKFTIVQNSTCIPSKVSFINNSSDFNNTVWDFGTGQISTLKNPIYTYTSVGLFKPLMVLFDSLGCKASYTYPGFITVDSVPVAKFEIPALVCDTSDVLFTNKSFGSVSWIWNLGNLAPDTSQSPTKTFAPGIYPIQLIATNVHGCKDTVSSPTLTVYQRPNAGFKSTDSIACLGTPIQFIDTSKTVNGIISQWWWTFENPLDLVTIRHPLYSFNNPGMHNVQLVVKDNVGCFDTVSIPNFVRIIDTLPPNNEPLVQVSVLTSNSIQVNWKPTQIQDFRGYTLYMKPYSSPGQYKRVFTSLNKPDSTFTVRGLFVSDTSYRFLMRLTNKCGAESFLNESFAHRSILAKSEPFQSKFLRVFWNAYEGWLPDKYLILRKLKSETVFELIDSVNGNITSYIDSNLCSTTYTYAIQAIESATSRYSFSNETSTKLVFVPGPSDAEILNVSVTDNRFITVNYSPSKQVQLNKYILKRSKDEGVTYLTNFAVLDKNTLSFDDHLVDVNSRPYYYKVFTLDNCGNESIESAAKRSIYLTSIPDEQKATLQWNSFSGWKYGVKNYRVERHNYRTALWAILGTTSNTTFEDVPIENYFPDYRYRVIAIENNINTQSFSNETTVLIAPLFFIPNIITPNNDNLNDKFEIFARHIISYELIINNRWGEEIFKTTDLNTLWDGYYKGEKVQQGMYVVRIKATGMNGKPILKYSHLSVVY